MYVSISIIWLTTTKKRQVVVNVIKNQTNQTKEWKTEINFSRFNTSHHPTWSKTSPKLLLKKLSTSEIVAEKNYPNNQAYDKLKNDENSSNKIKELEIKLGFFQLYFIHIADFSPPDFPRPKKCSNVEIFHFLFFFLNLFSCFSTIIFCTCSKVYFFPV